MWQVQPHLPALNAYCKKLEAELRDAKVEAELEDHETLLTGMYKHRRA